MNKTKVLLLSLLSVFVIFILYQGIGSLIALLLFKNNITDNINNFRLFTVASQILLILLPALIFSKKFFAHINEVFPTEKINLRQISLFFLGYFILYSNLSNIIYFQSLLMDYLSSISPAFHSIKTFFESNSNDIEKMYKSILSVNNVVDFLIVFIMVAITPAMCEELFFRGFLQHFMQQKFNFFITALFVGLFFSLMHFDFTAFIPYILLSIYFSYVVYRSNSIFSSIFLHFTNNFMAFLASLLLKSDDIFNKSKITSDMDLKTSILSFIVLTIAFIILIIYIEKSFKISSEIDNMDDISWVIIYPMNMY